MGSDVDEVSRYLKMKSINIPSNNEWLTSCVECFKEQGNYDLKQLKELVYQQWLLADLSDIAVQVLPDSCLTAEKFVLEGRYAVQLNYFVNIALSFHKQMQKIRKPEVMQNLEVDSDNPSSHKEAGSGNRTLKIEVTDGVLTVVAFEDHFISSLQEPLVPGMKSILIGPLECRKGIIFLRPSNLQILGGEVDALLIPNAAENVLARALKLPENPDPYHLNEMKVTPHSAGISVNCGNNDDDDDEEAMMMLAEVIEKEVPPENSSAETSRIKSEINKYNPSFFNNEGQSKIIQPSSNSRLGNQTVNDINQQIITDEFDDDMADLEQKIFLSRNTTSAEFDEDFELLAEQAEQSHCNNSRAVTNLDMPEYKEYDLTSTRKHLEQIADLKKKLKESYGSNDIRPSTSSSNSSEMSSVIPLRREKIIVDYLSESESPLSRLMDEPDDNVPTSSFPSRGDDTDDGFFSRDPFPPQKRPALVKVPARVIKMSKPKLKDDKWSVSASVAARGIELEVNFASDVIDKVFNISAAEIVSKKSELISNPDMKQEINEMLKRSQKRFSTLSSIMVFNFKDAISKPVVVDIE